MPAGDLLTADWQVELQGLLMGAGTSYRIAPPGVQGLAVPSVKSNDTNLAHTHGSYAGKDYYGPRLITVPLRWGGAGQATAMNNLATLVDAWEPVAADVEIWFRWPGWGEFYFVGRPRGCEESPALLKAGEMAAMCTFVALDPTRYVP